jgi:hypothetical protein
MDKSTRKRAPPYTLLVIFEGVIVYYQTTDSSYVYYDCRGATVGERGSMAWMPAYIAIYLV